MRHEIFFNHVVENNWPIKHIPFQKKHKTLPSILTRQEVKAFLSVLEDPKYFAIASTLYGSGLRLSECLNLKIEDIDSANMVITVRDGKGKKDRVTILSEKLLAAFICHSSFRIRSQLKKDTGYSGTSFIADYSCLYTSDKRLFERSKKPSRYFGGMNHGK